MTFTTENDRIFCAENGRTLAEVTFPETAPGVVVIDHTWVDGWENDHAACRLGR